MSTEQVRTKTTLANVEIKQSGPAGTASAVFSTFGVKDHDNDVVVAGAIADGTEVVIGAYNHFSVRGGALPVGKGLIHADASKAWVDLNFFMDTEAGRDHWSVVKQLGQLQEYSYTFKILDAAPGRLHGEPVQFLKDLDVFEVSPVIRGASIGTHTVAGSVKEELAAIRDRWARPAIQTQAQAVATQQFLRSVRTRWAS
jgi:hypothetical protein